MGHGRLSRDQLAAVGRALRASRAGDRLLETHPRAGLQGGS
jgi:hypothetical protein